MFEKIVIQSKGFRKEFIGWPEAIYWLKDQKIQSLKALGEFMISMKCRASFNYSKFTVSYTCF